MKMETLDIEMLVEFQEFVNRECAENIKEIIRSGSVETDFLTKITIALGMMEKELKKEKPYVNGKYNPKYGNNRICRCGHTYERHFDFYDDAEPVGCKYCDCDHFVEFNPMKDIKIGDRIEFTQEGMPMRLHGKVYEINEHSVSVKCKNGVKRHPMFHKIIKICNN